MMEKANAGGIMCPMKMAGGLDAARARCEDGCGWAVALPGGGDAGGACAPAVMAATALMGLGLSALEDGEGEGSGDGR